MTNAYVGLLMSVSCLFGFMLGLVACVLGEVRAAAIARAEGDGDDNV